MSERRDPFRGFVDSISEWNRMREYGMYGPEPAQEEQRRTLATAWIPNADIFARDEPGASLPERILRGALGGQAPRADEPSGTVVFSSESGVSSLTISRKNCRFEEGSSRRQAATSSSDGEGSRRGLKITPYCRYPETTGLATMPTPMPEATIL